MNDKLELGHILLIDNTAARTQNDATDENYHPSGLNVLNMLKLGLKEKSAVMKCKNERHKMIKCISYNTILKVNTHNGSAGDWQITLQ